MVLNNNKYMGEKPKWGEPDEFGEGQVNVGSGSESTIGQPKTLEELAATAARRKFEMGKKVLEDLKNTPMDPDLAGFLNLSGDTVTAPSMVETPKREIMVDEFDDNVDANSVEPADVGLHLMPKTKDELSGANKIIKSKKHERKNLRYESEFKGLEDKLIGILEGERDYIVEDVSISRDKNGRYVLTVKFKQRGPEGKKIRSLQVSGSSHDDLEKTVRRDSLGLPQAGKRR